MAHADEGNGRDVRALCIGLPAALQLGDEGVCSLSRDKRPQRQLHSCRLEAGKERVAVHLVPPGCMPNEGQRVNANAALYFARLQRQVSDSVCSGAAPKWLCSAGTFGTRSTLLHA